MNNVTQLHTQKILTDKQNSYLIKRMEVIEYLTPQEIDLISQGEKACVSARGDYFILREDQNGKPFVSVIKEYDGKWIWRIKKIDSVKSAQKKLGLK